MGRSHAARSACLGIFGVGSVLACVKFWTGNPDFALGLWDQNDSSFAYTGKQVAQEL